ncbi:dTDP-4-dehydrorhamnose 3,5-epimerase [Petrocella sp. FN5]|uniref:dTDP-4-dehydrorhamnose 3,5-epimerase n=1 Tax=Petrocella sp. FN5 TaxID=3032002 RepID=UPI0023DA414C|nr:dTDP-4-dehydrorhamnose 3,5-epimerase [Petrocella sp. FN5]MDF1618111.1 dTDP-4-dehydrorhamnose 3,5-epimerase [Petrocella sp. FN5]
MDKIGTFTFAKTELEGLMIIEPHIFSDPRGYFMEGFHYDIFKKAGIDIQVRQMNMSQSVQGVLRGMHYQEKYPQAKLVKVLRGEIFDVAVDVRKGSSTYGRWFGAILSEENKKQLFIPRGFAHGFLVLSEKAEFLYMVDNDYHPEDEVGFIWNDPSIGIKWPLMDGMTPLLSDKDRLLKPLER